jgi:hypothetical protein
MHRASAYEKVMVSLSSGGFLTSSVTVTRLDGCKKLAPM